MTPEQFKIFWASTYSDALPISHLLKGEFNQRWFRIHSSPQGKRFPSTENEWNILLTRQNIIITDLLGENERALLVSGDYSFSNAIEIHATKQDQVLRGYSFQQFDEIDLNRLDSEQYDEHEVYRPAFAEITWKSKQHDNLLKAIANDELRAFFISENNTTIIAPYDGGVDIIFKNANIKNLYREKYQHWLSTNKDGL